MAQASPGDTVRVEYTGKLSDGTVFDSSEDRDPLEFTLGAEQVIDGFERAVEGLSPGDTTTAKLDPDNAYGERDEELLFRVERSELPEDMEPQVGDTLEVRPQQGSAFDARVADVAEDSVLLDANHPLAGHELTFDIELVDIV